MLYSLNLLFYNFAPTLISLFGGDVNTISYGVLQAHTFTLFYFLLAFSHSAAAILRGAGKSTIPMYVMLVSWCAIRITYITVVGRLFDNIQLIFMAYPITWSISTVIFAVYLFKTDWMHNFERQELKECA